MNKTIASRILGPIGGLFLASAVLIVLFLGGANKAFLIVNLVLGIACITGSLLLSERGGVKRFFTGRAAYFGFFTGISALAVLLTLGVVNFVAHKKPQTWDLTKNKLFTLSEDTVKTLASLKTEVKAIAFYRQDDPVYRQLGDLLKRYADHSPHFKYEFIDPYKSPELVKRYNITEAGSRLVLTTGDGKAEAMVKELEEQGITNGLVKVTREGTRKIYFTEGHGEPDPRDGSQKGYGAAVKALETEGFQVATLSLLTEAEVPADATVVLVVAPRKAFLQPEVEALTKFAAAGGKLGIFVEPEVESGLDSLLKEWGVEADDNMVVDPNPIARLFGGTPITPVIQQYAQHDITKGLPAVAIPTARSLVALQGAKSTPLALALSGQTSWGETNIKSLYASGAKPDEGEKRGPMPVAMLITRSTAGEQAKRSDEARVMVFGDGEFFSNQYGHILGNMDLFLNSANWLAAQEDRITIRPKSRESSRLFLTDAQASGLKYSTLIAFPVALLGLGLAVWQVRRSK
jgi:ABC-type uncharacterized transport system involved in gliding motility auxiliary subunit